MKKGTDRNDATFRRLHAAGELLVLPNAWDAGTARLVESAGAKAVATTSAGVAWAHGYADGDRVPVELVVSTVAGIVRVVGVPVTTDIEGGYSADPAEVENVVSAVLDAGAVGINIEDGAADPDLLCRKIERAKRAAVRAGVDLFINARTDVYLRGLAPDTGQVIEVLRRAELYRATGADGLFVPGVTAAADIAAVCAGATLPVNVLAWPGLPPAAELRRLGVRRLSGGSAIAQAALGRVKALAVEFLATGDSAPLTGDGLAYADLNSLMT